MGRKLRPKIIAASCLIAVGTVIPTFAFGQSVGLPSDFNLWSLLQEGGRTAFIGLLFYLWLDQRAEARSERAKKDVIIKEKEALHERVLLALNATANTTDDLVKLLSGGASGKH